MKEQHGGGYAQVPATPLHTEAMDFPSIYYY